MSKQAMKLALEAYMSAGFGNSTDFALQRKAYDLAMEALAEQPAQQTCNCRWEGEVQVQQCTLHEAHVDAIHEWAERAKAAEAKLAEQPARPYRQLQDNGSKYFGESWDKAEQPAQQEPLTGWQPIETAPKGPTILLYSPNPKEFSMRYRNINVAWWVSTQITEYWGTAVFFDGRSHVQHIHNPTHWMPLPDVPAAHNIKENA